MFNPDLQFPVLVVCPCCHGGLEESPPGLRCSVCGREFPVCDSIPGFTQKLSDWQLIDDRKLDAVLEAANAGGWQAALDQLDRNRADWIRGSNRFTLAVFAGPKGRVLDCGCGWGGLSFTLAREFQQVFAFDAERHGLRFIRLRAVQDGIRNVVPVQGSVFQMPFPDGFFDVVVLNGVLEWVGTFDDSAGPGELQIRALKEIARVLNPAGTLHVAIENRFGAQYFLGYREEHTGLRFISVLPRFLARRWHRLKKDREFRALTHSLGGLRGMLKRCGFNFIKSFGMYPSYRSPRFIFSVDAAGAMRFLARQVVSDRRLSGWFSVVARAAAFFAPLGARFSPSWGLMASRTKPPELTLKTGLSTEPVTAADRELAVSVGDRTASLFVVQKCGGRLLQKGSFPMTDRASQKMARAGAFSACLCRRPELAGHLVPVRTIGTGHGVVAISDAVQGGRSLSHDRRQVDALVEVILKLVRMELTVEERGTLAGLRDITPVLRSLAGDSSVAAHLNRCQPIHGDLNEGNMLIDCDSGRLVLLDYEHACLGPAFLNWYDFLARCRVLRDDPFPLAYDVALHRCEELLRMTEGEGVWAGFTRRILGEAGVPIDLHRPLFVLYLKYLCQDRIIRDSDSLFASL